MWSEASSIHSFGTPIVDLLRFIPIIKSWTSCTRILRKVKLSQNERLMYWLAFSLLVGSFTSSSRPTFVKCVFS